MTPSARLASTIALLEILLPTLEKPRAVPVDVAIGKFFRERRFIGSKDRGAISGLAYAVIRHFASLSWWVERSGLPHFNTPSTARSLCLAARRMLEAASVDALDQLCNGGQYAPAPLSHVERDALARLPDHPTPHPDMTLATFLDVPPFALTALAPRFGGSMEAEVGALSQEAPLDLRVNTLKTTREDALAALIREGFGAKAHPFIPTAIRLEKRAAIFGSELFKQGGIEVQDAGSQWLALVCDAQPGMKVMDFCAGAGGKTLALAAAMRNKGRIIATDVSESRMRDIKKRLARAGVDNVATHVLANESDPWLKRHEGTADRVLVDAPCSGSGTWRRNPDLKWRVNEESIAELTVLQARILQRAARLVKPGGLLIYATCSLFPAENALQAQAFLTANNHFTVASLAEIWNRVSPSEERSGFSPADLSATHSTTSMASSSASAATIPSPSAWTAEGFLSLSPHQDGTDGFFAAAFARS